MNNDFILHEDDRRCLIEWISDMTVCSLKAITMKSSGTIGKHYHKKKNEVFFLLEGTAIKVIIGDEEYTDIEAPFKWVVPKNIYHSLHLVRGAVVLSACDKPYDPEDDYD